MTQTRLHELLQEAAFQDQILLEQDPLGDEIARGLRDPENFGYAAVETSAFQALMSDGLAYPHSFSETCGTIATPTYTPFWTRVATAPAIANTGWRKQRPKSRN